MLKIYTLNHALLRPPFVKELAMFVKNTKVNEDDVGTCSKVFQEQRWWGHYIDDI